MNALRSSVRNDVRTKGIVPVVLSYGLDWVLLAAGAVLGYFLGDITPNKRPFSVDDRGIGFPYTDGSTVPNWLLIVCSTIIPILVIAFLSLLLNPGVRDTRKSVVWTHKLWELHAGWQGLALSMVSTWILTNGIKTLVGKPRPDMLARCRPDLANLSNYFVGENPFSNSSALLSANICTQTDVDLLNDGFRSFPSGHASLSAAGLMYLTLFLFSKFRIMLPLFYLAGSVTSPLVPAASHPAKPSLPADTSEPQNPTTVAQTVEPEEPPAPPLYLLLIALIPFCSALFIGISRWFDFRHSGTDIIAGFIIGAAAAFFAFRYYHAPLARKGGRALGPRSRGKAFWPGTGTAKSVTECARCGSRSSDEEIVTEGYNGRATALQGKRGVERRLVQENGTQAV